ncbi:uncharacterized protein LOC123524940 isoform X1 [Mercenaria mercenaria]|uniref:uncharacterized protein LOC123524940 isoform X1 n=1 Tax=Mercenaria mercenaria TaxID=6596 RepID=UPI00234FB385|nr:uncharacterized protein LOC123524940 isoform X1 [Mercenaria mercenaria]
MIRFQRTGAVIIKLLLRFICLISIFTASMLCFIFVVSDHHIAHNNSQSNQAAIVITRNQSSNEDTLFENPSNYLQSKRFDLIFKMVYAYFYVYKERIPKVIQDAYAEHIRVWNNFKEHCLGKEFWFDGNIPCKEKVSKSDFILSFHKTIETIKTSGFNSSMSRIPIDNVGFLLNGAHRISASVILSKNACFEHHSYKQRFFNWGYKFFKGRGLSEKTSDMVMLEWMKIQLKLPYLNTLVFIVSVFSNNRGKDDAMRKIVKERCSKDNGILYEREINFTQSGMWQLFAHMYGQQAWLETEIQQMVSKFNSTFTVVFLFIYAKSNRALDQCQNEIRKLYSDKLFKYTVHIPDTAEENLILAEMILNPNSIQFMNYAKKAFDCKLIAKEVASRSSIAPISTLPGIYVVRDDVMIDSGTVLGFFDLRRRTDVDLLFLHGIDKALLGNDHGILIQAHAFKNNPISKGRAWGEDHFSHSGATDKWDLFYNPKNYGYCYGIKFVSLKQLVRYKMKRNEPKKDLVDVELINELLETIS